MIKIMPAKYMIETTVIPGCMNTSMDNTIAKAPRPISAPRFQPGEFESVI